MPYVRCPRCGLMVDTAAAWSATDRCASCHTPLPRPVRDADATGVGPRRAAPPRRRDARERRWSEGVLGEALRELGRG